MKRGAETKAACAAAGTDDIRMQFCARRGYPLPSFSHALFGYFSRYIRMYLGRNFHAVRVSKAGPAPGLLSGPVIFYTNHPSWWDPVLMMLLAGTYYPKLQGYAPMDAQALKKYGFFKKLGVFGIEDNCFRGAAVFLCTTWQVLHRPGSALWITAEGRFTDARQRPVRLRPGIGHLARDLDQCTVIPVAFEYPFWRERYPEALIRFGPQIQARQSLHRPVRQWTALFEQQLDAAMSALAAESLTRDPSLFETLIFGTAGIGGMYDRWRRLMALMQGKNFHTGHDAPEA